MCSITFLRLVLAQNMDWLREQVGGPSSTLHSIIATNFVGIQMKRNLLQNVWNELPPTLSPCLWRHLIYFCITFSAALCIIRIQYICTFMALPSWNTSADWEGCYLLILCTVGDQPTHPTLTRCRVHFWSLPREVGKSTKSKPSFLGALNCAKNLTGYILQSGLQTFLILTLSYNSPRHSGIPTLWNQLCVAVH